MSIYISQFLDEHLLPIRLPQTHSYLVYRVRAQGFQVITLTAMAAAFTTAGIESVS